MKDSCCVHKDKEYHVVLSKHPVFFQGLNNSDTNQTIGCLPTQLLQPTSFSFSVQIGKNDGIRKERKHHKMNYFVVIRNLTSTGYKQKDNCLGNYLYWYPYRTITRVRFLSYLVRVPQFTCDILYTQWVPISNDLFLT